MLTDEQKQALVEQARQVRLSAYAPYSNYKVGAALLAANDQVYLGVNVENAVYPTGTCAERSAVFNAVTAGAQHFTAIAVVTANGGMPCGSCRQVLAEFGLETVVLIADERGQITRQTTVGDLLPGAFLAHTLTG